MTKIALRLMVTLSVIRLKCITLLNTPSAGLIFCAKKSFGINPPSRNPRCEPEQALRYLYKFVKGLQKQKGWKSRWACFQQTVT